MTTKEELYKLCQDYVVRRIESSQRAIAEAQESANQETKSSSGDKYETGRAMAQLEIEKNTQQLSEALKLKNTLDQIRIDVTATAVTSGSLVVTDRGIFFVAISLGKVVLQERTYFIIAPSSPLGQQLMGAKAGDAVKFKDHVYVVRELI